MLLEKLANIKPTCVMYLLSEPSHLKPLQQGCMIVQDKILALLQGTKKKKKK